MTSVSSSRELCSTTVTDGLETSPAWPAYPDGSCDSRGPWFEELSVGQVFAAAPAVTITVGQAALHQAVLGNRLRLSLDETLAESVSGRAPLAHPGLAWDIAIGQSTLATQNVRANLFYRGLVLERIPAIGDTLRTVTTVEALRENQRRPGRAPTGLAALRITTVDQAERTVLDFWRCAMIPLGNPDVHTGHHATLDDVGRRVEEARFGAAVEGWRLDALPEHVPGAVRFTDLTVGEGWHVAGGDLVSSAPELARLTLNVAAVHHDASAAGGRRLVYGGHTIGLALAQATRALPDIVAVTGWHSCDHLGPVYEGDTLRSAVVTEGLAALPGGGGLAHLRSRVTADDDGGRSRPVLDWRFTVVLS